MEFIDYYKILEIPKTATESDIKSAYRKLARKNHPDLNPNDENAKKKFQQINEANEVLSDPEKRKKYDKYGKDWKHSEEFEKANQHRQSQRNTGGQKNASNFSGDFSRDFSDFVDLGGRFNGKFNHFSTIRNPYTRASSQINSIFNLDTGATRVGKRDKVNTMFLDNLSGVALTENDVNHILGQELSKLDKPSKLITAVHLLIGSYIKENPRHSDKSMSFAQYVNRLYSPYSESGNLYIATSNFADHENGSDKFANFMMKYLIAEHDKIRMIANAKANDPILGVKLYKLEKFAYFDGILSKDLKDLLYKIKGNPLENNGLLEYLGYIYQNGNLKVVENTDGQVALRNRIIDDIKIYFNKKTKSLTRLYNKVGLFDLAFQLCIRRNIEHLIVWTSRTDINVCKRIGESTSHTTNEIKIVELWIGLLKHVISVSCCRSVGLIRTHVILHMQQASTKAMFPVCFCKDVYKWVEIENELVLQENGSRISSVKPC